MLTTKTTYDLGIYVFKEYTNRFKHVESILPFICTIKVLQRDNFKNLYKKKKKDNNIITTKNSVLK